MLWLKIWNFWSFTNTDMGQGWNQVSTTDLDDPLTWIVIRVRPRFDPDMTRLNKETLVEGSSLSFVKYALHTQQHTTTNTLSLHSVFAGLNTILVSWHPTLKGATRLTQFEIAAMLYFLSYPSSSLKYS